MKLARIVTKKAAPPKLKMLKFSAAWCQPCKTQAPIAHKFVSKYPEITLKEIDAGDTGESMEAAFKKHLGKDGEGLSAIPVIAFLHRDVCMVIVGLTSFVELEEARTECHEEILRAAGARRRKLAKSKGKR